MADTTDFTSLHAPVDVPSLASFRKLTARDDARADTTEIARVAGELLTDARGLRGTHGDELVLAVAGSPEHELHVSLHACERTALAAQRRGVEALTARLCNDQDELEAHSAAALGDLESAARSLLTAASLSDQLLGNRATDGPPPPPIDVAEALETDAAGPTAAPDVDESTGIDDRVVLDLRGPSVGLGYRADDDHVGDGIDEQGDVSEDDARTPLDAALDPEALGVGDWEARRQAIFERIDDVRSDRETDVPATGPLFESSMSPIVAAALTSPIRHVEPTDAAGSEPEPTPPAEVAADGPAVDDHEGDIVALDEVAAPDVDAATATAVDGDDAMVIDITDARSATPSLAEVIELQTEAVEHEWPVWQGPYRDEAIADVVVESAPEYPRLVSVAPDPAPARPESVKETAPDVEEKRPTFSFAPEPTFVPEPPDDESHLPVPLERRSQEDIAAEARALIARQQREERADVFSPREAKRRQRRLRKHQRAVEKAEGRVQRDRRRAELDHERSLAERTETSTGSYSPSWFGQLAFALAICLLVVMVAVGVWFLLASDPGLF